MTKSKPANVPASVRQRLLNVAQETRQDFGLLLTKYALERLLYRLSTSPYRSVFVLKGALLFDLWTTQPHRPTRDLDLLGHGDSSLDTYRRIFGEICESTVEDDGLSFVASTVVAERIKDEEDYEGVRVRLQARLGVARIPLQIDIGFGDVITPAPIEVEYPAMLQFPPPRLRAYPRETVVAEKFEAMVKLGMANSRMKDFYDLFELSRRFDFDGSTLKAAIQATFQRRATIFPRGTPLPFTLEFSDDRSKQTQWTAFLRKSGLQSAETLRDVVTQISSFLLPIIEAIQSRARFSSHWNAGGNWQ